MIIKGFTTQKEWPYCWPRWAAGRQVTVHRSSVFLQLASEVEEWDADMPKVAKKGQR
jgi:hypothetical protein